MEPSTQVEALASETTIETFQPIDLRVGLIVGAEAVEGSDKLLKLQVGLGPLGERVIFSGIAKSYAPEALIGKHVVVFANLKPRKMRFGISEGMLLAAGPDEAHVTLVELASTANPGDRIG